MMESAIKKAAIGKDFSNVEIYYYTSNCFIACSPKGSHVMIEDIKLPPKNPDEVEVITSDVDRNYKEIAILEAQKAATSVFGTPTLNDVIPELKKQAAQLGADAIINIQTETGRGSGSWRNVKSIHATATAIIWTE